MQDRGAKKIKKNKPRKPPRKPLSFGFIFSIFRILSLLGFVLVLSAGFVFCHDIILQLPYFNIKNIDIAGLSRITKDHILEKSGIAQGMNLFTVNAPKATKTLETEAWIESVDMSITLPGTVSLRIKERDASALIDLGEYYVVDSTGKVFKKYEPGDPEKLPVITGLSYQDTLDTESPGNGFWISVLDLLKKGKEKDALIPAEMIDSISVDYQIGINMALSNGPKIKLGASDLDRKLERLSLIMNHNGVKKDYSKIETIDLQNINRIIVGFKKEAPAEAEGKEV